MASKAAKRVVLVMVDDIVADSAEVVMLKRLEGIGSRMFGLSKA